MIARLFLVYALTFFIGFCGLQLIAIFVEIDPGESIGRDWYLIKSYNEIEVENNNGEYIERSIEHGNGTINIPLILGFIVTGIYLLVKGFNKKDQFFKGK